MSDRSVFMEAGERAQLPVARFGRPGNLSISLKEEFGDLALLATHVRVWPAERQGWKPALFEFRSEAKGKLWLRDHAGKLWRRAFRLKHEGRGKWILQSRKPVARGAPVTIPIRRADRYVLLTTKRYPLIPKPRPGQLVEVQLLIDEKLKRTFQTYFSFVFFVINNEGYRIDVRGPPNKVTKGLVPLKKLRDDMIEYLDENDTALIAEAIRRRFGGVPKGAKWEIVRGGYTYVVSYGKTEPHPGRGRAKGSVKEYVARRKIGVFAESGDWIERDTSTKTDEFRESFAQLRRLKRKVTRRRGRQLFRGDREPEPRPTRRRFIPGRLGIDEDLD